MEKASREQDFKGWRGFFWPIHKHELSKFLPLFLLAFFVGFNYSLLRNMKDALLVASAGAGAEVIPFIKVWGIVPAAIIVTMIYGYLSRKYERRVVFHMFMTFFLLFFIGFVFLVYPLGDIIHCHSFSDKLKLILPAGLRGFISMIRYWSYSLFYVVSELWSSVVLSILFWGVANEVTNIKEAGRFYGLINTSLNLSSIFAGEISVWIGKQTYIMHAFAKDPWHNVMINITLMVTCAGCIMVWLYRKLDNGVGAHQELYAKSYENENVKESAGKSNYSDEKQKPESKGLFLYLVKSKYLLSIAVIVLSYNLSIHLFEVVWKDQVSRIYSTALEYNNYMSRISTIIGIVSVFAAMFMTSQLIRLFGWTVGALITPMVMSLTGFIFFLAIFAAKKDVSLLGAWCHATPMVLAAWIGGFQNIFTRSAKFTFFDQTKETAFIPLSSDEKNQGKAAIDGIVSRVGKSGGSLLYQGLLIFFSSVASCLNIIMGVLSCILVVWMAAIVYAGKKFADLEDKDSVVDSSVDEDVVPVSLDLQDEDALVNVEEASLLAGSSSES